MSQDDDDPFDDLQDTGFGALGGEGAGALDRVKTSIDSAGIHNKCYCELCGTSNLVNVEWLEAIIGSLQFAPPNWQFDPKTGTLYPYIGCANPGCRREIRIGFTPAELKRYVTNAVAARQLDQNYVSQNVASITARAAQARGGR